MESLYQIQLISKEKMPWKSVSFYLILLMGFTGEYFFGRGSADFYTPKIPINGYFFRIKIKINLYSNKYNITFNQILLSGLMLFMTTIKLLQ